MENKIEEFNNALCDVRRAHRLIYSYQKRMLDLAYFIKTKLDFPDLLGKKHFSEDISKKRYGYLSVFNDMWAWDFLYSYLFEYYFGEIELDNGNSCAFSIIQYSDTGYFEQVNGGNKLDISSFAEEEDSVSKLLFFLEVKPKKKDWIWNIEELIIKNEYASKQHKATLLEHEKGNMQVLYSFTLDDFLNERTSLEALKEFVDYCSENNVVELSII